MTYWVLSPDPRSVFELSPTQEAMSSPISRRHLLSNKCSFPLQKPLQGPITNQPWNTFSCHFFYTKNNPFLSLFFSFSLKKKKRILFPLISAAIVLMEGKEFFVVVMVWFIVFFFFSPVFEPKNGFSLGMKDGLWMWCFKEARKGEGWKVIIFCLNRCFYLRFFLNCALY